jgi:hypothetical protein
MKKHFMVRRLFPKTDDRPRPKVLADRMADMETVRDMEKSPGWQIVLREFDRMFHVEHDALMRLKDPISADEYRGFVRALSLAAMTPAMVMHAGTEAAEAMEDGKEGE